MKEHLKEILNCRETSEIPEKLLKTLLDKDRCNDLLVSIDKALKHKEVDEFRDFFQNEQSNRKELKQDYTPDGISLLLANIAHKTQKVADICSGTGSLILGFLKEHPEVEFVRCEEFSIQAIPFLLLNLMLKNIDGEVIHGDSLTKEIFKVYKLKRSDKFSNIEIGDSPSNERFDTVISNPPYSLKWNPVHDERFDEYGSAPASKADYAFVLHAFSLLNKNGELLEILPHGVLFRGGGEGKIKEKLLINGNITSVIGLPEKLFLNTSIPTVVLSIKKQRKEDDILFIDASKYFEKGKKQNSLGQENIQHIVKAYNDRKFIDKFAYVSTFSEVENNDFNLNIPRYVDTYEPEEEIDLEQCLSGWLSVKEEISKAEDNILEMFSELVPTNKTNTEKFNREKELFSKIVHKTKTNERKSEEIQTTLF